MAVTKPKDMPPFWVLSVFGYSYDNYRHQERLYRLFMEIEFKWAAVLTALDLIIKQEKIIQEAHKAVPTARTYQIEITQMAYLGFFLDAIYALTERISHVTKIFHNNKLRDGFNKQRKDLIDNPTINPKLSQLMTELSWYKLFIEIRTEHSHYGTSILAYGYDIKPEDGYSQLIIDIGGKKDKKILTGTRYNFDLRKTTEIKEGVSKFIQEWSLLLLKKLDLNINIMPNEKRTITLKKFMEDRGE